MSLFGRFVSPCDCFATFLLLFHVSAVPLHLTVVVLNLFLVSMCSFQSHFAVEGKGAASWAEK